MPHLFVVFPISNVVALLKSSLVFSFGREITFEYHKQISDSSTTAYTFEEFYCKQNKIKLKRFWLSMQPFLRVTFLK